MNSEVSDQRLSIEALRNRMGPRRFDLMHQALFPGSYEDWIAAFYQTVDEVSHGLVEDAHHYRDLGEEALSKTIVRRLQPRYFNATTESDSGGHSDFYVHSNAWTWVGEAKIHCNDYAYLAKGMRQLLTRYSTGMLRHGGLFIYTKSLPARTLMNRWRQRLPGHIHTITTCDDAISPLAFRSIHEHPKSGIEYEVRHVVIPLIYEPEIGRAHV